MAANRKIYCAPSSATTILEIDPATQTTVNLGSIPSGTDKYIGNILAPNGSIYCIPFFSPNVLKIGLAGKALDISTVTDPRYNKY
jgi:hypothetical protein